VASQSLPDAQRGASAPDRRPTICFAGGHAVDFAMLIGQFRF
jgi:hypothetical protein